MTSICKIDIIEKEVQNYFSHIITQPSWPFNLQPLFWKGVEKWFEKPGLRNLVWEIWFKKSGSRKMVLQTWIFLWEKWLTRKKTHIFSGWRKVVLQTRIFFSGSRKVVDQKKKIRLWRTLYLEPLFYTFLEKWWQIKWLSD